MVLITFDNLAFGKFKVKDPVTKAKDLRMAEYLEGNHTWNWDGYGEIQKSSFPNGTGNELFTNNINAGLTLRTIPAILTLLFKYNGGSMNLGINGDFRELGNIQDFIALHGTSVGSVKVSVILLNNNIGQLFCIGDMRKFRLKSGSYNFIIGGQEFSIFNIFTGCVTKK